MLFTSDIHKRISIALDMIFPPKWLAERAEIDPLAEMNGNTKGNEQGKTNYQVQKEVGSLFNAFSLDSSHFFFCDFLAVHAPIFDGKTPAYHGQYISNDRGIDT